MLEGGPTAANLFGFSWTAWLDLTAAELLPGEVAPDSPRSPGGARHGGGEVDRLLNVRAVRPQTEVLGVNGVLRSRSKIKTKITFDC